MNWDSEREMAKDVEENEELYEALADNDTDDDVISDTLQEGPRRRTEARRDTVRLFHTTRRDGWEVSLFERRVTQPVPV